MAEKITIPKVGEQERMVTRVAAVALGLLFIGVPLVSLFFYSNQRQELAQASVAMWLAVIGACLCCAAVGIIFLAVGIEGVVPAWLAQTFRQ